MGCTCGGEDSHTPDCLEACIKGSHDLNKLWTSRVLDYRGEFKRFSGLSAAMSFWHGFDVTNHRNQHSELMTENLFAPYKVPLFPYTTAQA